MWHATMLVCVTYTHTHNVDSYIRSYNGVRVDCALFLCICVECQWFKSDASYIFISI